MFRVANLRSLPAPSCSASCTYVMGLRPGVVNIRIRIRIRQTPYVENIPDDARPSSFGNSNNYVLRLICVIV